MMVLIMLMLLVLVCLSVVGEVKLPLFAILKGNYYGLTDKLNLDIYFYLKLPTILSILFLGLGLGASGCVMQGLMQNPLADPTILGVSSSASFFALLGLIILPSGFMAIKSINILMVLGSFFGAILVMTILIFFSKVIQNGRIVGVLLAGVALGAMFGALTIMAMNFMSIIQLKASIAWMFGSVSEITWQGFYVILITFSFGILVLYQLHRKLDILILGFQEAEISGVSVQNVLLVSILGVSVIISGSVAIVGPIGFVGLVSPHIAREISGGKHKFLIINSALVAGNIMLIAELISKNIYPPYIIPLSAITAIMGGPFFLWLLWKYYKKSEYK